MCEFKNMMHLIAAFILLTLPIITSAAPMIIGKDQAPINAHDYAILKEVANNAQLPIEAFRHFDTKRTDWFVLGKGGVLYRDKNKNGVIDGKDRPEFISISRLDNSYITNSKGEVIALSIDQSKFNDTSILNKLKKLVAINLNYNNVSNINIANLPELRMLTVFEKQSTRTLTALSNVNKLAYFKIFGLNAPNFKNFTGVDGLYKMEINGMAIESFAGLENMPNLKELEVSASKEGDIEKFRTLTGIPKGHKLEKLILSTAFTRNIDQLANFTQLKRLELWASQKALADFSPLNKLKHLEELEATVHGVTDYSFIKDMPKLKKIVTYHAPVTSLAGVSNAPNLEHLEIQKGKVSKIDHLENNTNLKTLIINANELTKIEGLETLKKLNTLDVSSNQIKKIEGLDKNLCLEKLWLAANPIKELENVYHLPFLYEMSVDGTEITEFPNWQKLQRLHTLVVNKYQLNPEHFHKENFWWVNVPIKDFDLKMRQSPEITDEERKKQGCI